MAVQKTSGASSRAALGATVIAGILVAGFGGAALTALTADNAHQPGQSLVLVGQRDDYALRLADEQARASRAGVGQRDDYALRLADGAQDARAGVGQRDDYALRLADGAQDARAGVGQRDDYALRHADDK